jgi:hypothetical protein
MVAGCNLIARSLMITLSIRTTISENWVWHLNTKNFHHPDLNTTWQWLD